MSSVNLLTPSAVTNYGTNSSTENHVVVQVKEPQNSEDPSQELRRIRLKEIAYKVAFASSLSSFFIFQTACSEHVYQLTLTDQNQTNQTQKIANLCLSGTIGLMTGLVVDYYDTFKPYVARTFKNVACVAVPAMVLNSVRYSLKCAGESDLAKCELDNLLSSQINTFISTSAIVALQTMYLAWPFKKNQS